jgi:hypothetical protein
VERAAPARRRNQLAARVDDGQQRRREVARADAAVADLSLPCMKLVAAVQRFDDVGEQPARQREFVVGPALHLHVGGERLRIAQRQPAVGPALPLEGLRLGHGAHGVQEDAGHVAEGVGDLARVRRRLHQAR